MKKKIYIMPQLEVVEFAMGQMLCASIIVSESGDKLSVTIGGDDDGDCCHDDGDDVCDCGQGLVPVRRWGVWEHGSSGSSLPPSSLFPPSPPPSLSSLASLLRPCGLSSC